MKTLHELAIEYAKSIYQEEYDDPTFAPDVFQTKNDFAAGYNAALENTKPKNICEHVYVSNLDPDEEDYDLICKKCGHRTN